MKKTQSTRRNGIYFNTENFIQMLLKEIKMDKASPEVIEELSNEIAQTLSERVTAVVVASLGEKEVFLLQKTLEDHPELDEIDALSIITSYIPGLDNKILEAVSDLFDELVENSRSIDEKLNSVNKTN